MVPGGDKSNARKWYLLELLFLYSFSVVMLDWSMFPTADL